MKKWLLCFCLLWAFYCPGQQTNSRNYILSRTYKQSGASSDDLGKVIIQVQYLDGLGRPVQTVLVGQNPSGQDLVESVEYDAAGRVFKKYLPYAVLGNGAFQANAPAAAVGWYGANQAGLAAPDLGRPFVQTFFEASPVSQVSGQRQPGNQSAASVVKRKVNVAGQVNRYDYDPALNQIVQVGQYGAGTLVYRNTTDEQGNVTNEFTDLLGQMICRQVIPAAGSSLSTYYVFDDLGLLRGVLQPAYQDVASLADHAFTYDYDDRARLVVKRVPGKGVTELVYDQYNRLAMWRSPGQLSRGVWGFAKYDALNRPVASGEIASADSRQNWSVAVDAFTAHHEERANAALAGYSLDQTAPKSAKEQDLFLITFYDDYLFSKAAGLAYQPVYYPSFNNAVKGQKTGGRERVLLSNANPGPWLDQVTYYDPEYRPVQSSQQLHGLGPGAIQRISSQYKYDLAPVLSQQLTEQVIAGNTTSTHLATYSYDHADRLLSVHEKVASGASQQQAYTVANRYNALGQLQSKWLHSADGVHYLRKTGYTQNIRGWTTEARTVYKSQENGPELPFFGYGLAYDNGNTYTNGNISQMQWQDKDQAGFTKGLSFTYDGAGRLTGSNGILDYTDTESGITYDKNGNIKTLVRSGAAVDKLVYGYQGNKLTSVTDNSPASTGVKTGTSLYSYDLSGNMISDGNRGAVLAYNQIDLPKTIAIAGKTQTYDYAADGEKLQYASDTLTLKYAGNFEYRQTGNANTFSRAALSEGQAVIRNGKLVFEYYLKDHLGNIRVVFDQKGNVLQRTDYYPFGLAIERDQPVKAPKVRNWVNRFLYNGKELQVGSGYLDYGARFYLPEVGRWGSVDPLAEKYYYDSPYVYAGNNPIVNIDPLGMDWYKTTDGTMQYDPNIKSKKDVGEGQSYVGRTYHDKTDNGTVNYRKDGSIMYSHQTDAYNRIVSNSTAGGTHEESAAILKNGVLVLPSYDNNSTTADPGKYGYKFEGGNLVDAVDGKTKELVAMIHTHPDKGGSASPSYLNLGGGSDASFGGKNIPGKMNYVFGHDNYLYGITADRATGSLKYAIYNTSDFKFIRVSDVLKGQRINLQYFGQQFKYIAPNSKR